LQVFAGKENARRINGKTKLGENAKNQKKVSVKEKRRVGQEKGKSRPRKKKRGANPVRKMGRKGGVCQREKGVKENVLTKKKLDPLRD